MYRKYPASSDVILDPLTYRFRAKSDSLRSVLSSQHAVQLATLEFDLICSWVSLLKYFLTLVGRSNRVVVVFLLVMQGFSGRICFEGPNSYWRYWNRNDNGILYNGYSKAICHCTEEWSEHRLAGYFCPWFEFGNSQLLPIGANR
jgi:hypothetical protein